LSRNQVFHLALRLDGTAPLPPRDREAGAGLPLSAAGWLELIRAAEEAGVDFVTIEDAHRLPVGDPAGRLDAVMIACRVAPVTQRVGIVPMASATLTEPFLLSSQIATLDFISRGRAGWQLAVSTDPAEAQLVGPRSLPSGADVFRDALDHVEVVRRLWDSWDDDAEIRDAVTNRFIDRDRIHHIDFQGPRFSVKGPSITPRSPQGQPIVVTVVSDDATAELAIAAADVAIVATGDEGELSRRVQELRSAGRDLGPLRLLAEVALAPSSTTALTVTGPPARAAEQVAAWTRLGVDGFRLSPAGDPAHAIAIAAELSARGHVTVPAGPADRRTLRGRFGLERPANRYAAA
jgi:alkanesulfonate monooxygenase SsuD/methylene tetrahydromethanopterin reductase-like flavin-dependent oxidoreductase (luciferase family)